MEVNESMNVWRVWVNVLYHLPLHFKYKTGSILFNNIFEYVINKSKCDLKGNYIIVDITVFNEIRLTLITIYGHY